MKFAPLVVIRPEPGNAATVAAATALGLKVLGEPLFRIVATAWDAPPAETFDAVLIGSANALRHGGPALAKYLALPAYVVGKTTAQAATDAGCSVAATGSGGLQELTALLARDGRKRVLRIAGAEHVALSAPDTAITTVVVYEARPLPLTTTCAARLAKGAVVMLHSAAAARHFAAECERSGIARKPVALACLGPRIASAAGDGWGSLASAEQPDETALLALAAGMCQTAWFGETDDNN